MGPRPALVNRLLLVTTLWEPMTHRLPLFCSTLIAAMAAGALAACSVPVDQRGNLPEPKLLAEIQPGVSDKATVTRILGSPSSVAAFDADTWYYISQKTKNIAFFKPEILDQEVVAVVFNKDGLVQDVWRRDMKDREVIVPNSNATPAPGREFSFWEQLIGNFGKFGGAGLPGSSPGQPQQPGGGPGGPGR
jgi:outer membrane protein assembly factor BamE (lipoprotein component of BamABCDE complex)